MQVKRFDAVTRSPVYASFGAMLKACLPQTSNCLQCMSS